MQVRTAFFALMLVTVPATLLAEIITIEGVVKSVDSKRRVISIEVEGKVKKFDVGSKAKIVVDSKDDSLDSLKIGQSISLDYHDQLEVVVKVDAYSDKSNWINVFNGNDLQGWKFGSPISDLNSNSALSKRIDDLWFVDAERKVLVSRGKETCWLETDKTFKNFRLRCEWRFLSGGKVTDSG